jgi:4-hydroxy-tetrahydrodipicolinate synthase
LAEETGLPQCVYNIPGRSAKNIEPDTIIRLAELPNITMVKEATGSLDQASQIISATNLTVLSGDDSLTLPLMAIGGRGVISVVGNIVPKDMIALCKAMDAGNVAEARKWHHKLFPLCRDMLGLSTNPIPIKAAMKLLGRDPGELRLPMTALEPDDEIKLRKSLANYGLM